MNAPVTNPLSDGIARWWWGGGRKGEFPQVVDVDGVVFNGEVLTTWPQCLHGNIVAIHTAFTAD